MAGWLAATGTPLSAATPLETWRGQSSVGGLVGWNAASIGTSYATGTVWGSHTVGGLVGNSNSGGVMPSRAMPLEMWLVPMTGIRVGGLVGENYGSIRGSYAKGNVLGGFRVGGLVGANFSHGTIISSYAIGTVSGGSSGGLLGYNSDSSVVIASYATGAVSGDYDVGGLAGANDRPNGISVSHWDIESSGQSRARWEAGSFPALKERLLQSCRLQPPTKGSTATGIRTSTTLMATVMKQRARTIPGTFGTQNHV